MPNRAYEIKDISIVLEIYERARQRGKHSGDNCEEEFAELLKERPEMFELLGHTSMDIDMLAGNLREEGKKVINLKELSN